MIGQHLLSLAGVPPEKFEECLTWAFGEVNPGETMEDLRRRWNDKHRDIFFVEKGDHWKAFLWSVGKAYLDHNFNHRVIVPRRFVGGLN